MGLEMEINILIKVNLISACYRDGNWYEDGEDIGFHDDCYGCKCSDGLILCIDQQLTCERPACVKVDLTKQWLNKRWKVSSPSRHSNLISQSRSDKAVAKQEVEGTFTQADIQISLVKVDLTKQWLNKRWKVPSPSRHSNLISQSRSDKAVAKQEVEDIQISLVKVDLTKQWLNKRWKVPSPNRHSNPLAQRVAKQEVGGIHWQTFKSLVKVDLTKQWLNKRWEVPSPSRHSNLISQSRSDKAVAKQEVEDKQTLVKVDLKAVKVGGSSPSRHSNLISQSRSDKAGWKVPSPSRHSNLISQSRSDKAVAKQEVEVKVDLTKQWLNKRWEVPSPSRHSNLISQSRSDKAVAKQEEWKVPSPSRHSNLISQSRSDKAVAKQEVEVKVDLTKQWLNKRWEVPSPKADIQISLVKVDLTKQWLNKRWKVPSPSRHSNLISQSRSDKAVAKQEVEGQSRSGLHQADIQISNQSRSDKAVAKQEVEVAKHLHQADIQISLVKVDLTKQWLNKRWEVPSPSRHSNLISQSRSDKAVAKRRLD
ncbi:unnamed protein product [Mytilus edulis]|uniref:Uncharacterized protein n=1 Tax=Mytilus edulis TaxID=6550 RepID=A0A8S3Q8C2_MYTED|nr:unnamed protein product [Mytilus edulis]